MPIEAVQSAHRLRVGIIDAAAGAPLGTLAEPRSVGPVAVLGHALPIELEAGALPPDFDSRPHPHIGLAAITYVLRGHVTHRDSLGARQEVAPMAVSYMIAGSGIVHSERFERLRALGGAHEMLQILMPLPDGHEDVAPSYTHVAPADVPEHRGSGTVVRRIAGGDGAIEFPARLLLHDVRLEAGARYEPPSDYAERALYVIEGAIRVDGEPVPAQHTAVLRDGTATVTADAPARLIAFGGEPVGPRTFWWNFMHSSLDRIEAAKARWRAREVAPPPKDVELFALPPGDTESFTPAPPDDARPLRTLNAPG